MSPGYRGLPGGGSQIYVQLSSNVAPQLIKSAGSLTFVFAGFHVPVHNNRHALETQYFNTPVSDARLVQSKDDVRLVIVLRVPVDPVQRVVEVERGKTWELQLDFPAGKYPIHAHEHAPPQKRGEQLEAPDQQEPVDEPARTHRRHHKAPASHATSKSRRGALGPPTP
jgi:hypothetical protein